MVRSTPLWLMLVLLFSLALPCWSADSSVVVIANKNLENVAVNRTYLRSLFGMRARTWPSGAAVRVFVLKDNHEVHEKFAKSILKTFPYNLRKIWDSRVFSGVGASPTVVASEAEMYERVSETDNAIGYLSRGLAGPGVKVLELEKI